MEKQVQVQVNGAPILQGDLNLLGETSALADDRVFAELFRLKPTDGGTLHKAVVPYGHQSSSQPMDPQYAGIVLAGVTAGKVSVGNFRALIGSRTTIATDGKKAWQDIRSGILTGSLGDHKFQYTDVALAANSSGNARIDLIYAVVTPDANSATVTRKVKDPTTGTIASASVVVTKTTNVTVAAVTGTPAATPAVPALPSDAGGNYYIPLAYVRVRNGFNAGTMLAMKDVIEIAPVFSALPRSTGMQAVRFASAPLTAAKLATWANTGGARPRATMQTSAIGAERILIPIALPGAVAGNWSHDNTNNVLDNRIDWRGRCFRWDIIGRDAPAGREFAWEQTAPSGVDTLLPSSEAQTDSTLFFCRGVGQSFHLATPGAWGSNGYEVARVTSSMWFNHRTWTVTAQGPFGTPTDIYLWVDPSDGSLKVYVTPITNPNALLFVDLWVSPQLQAPVQP